ncbi:MAG: protein kinase [Planctomycetes bacterium]|nr:protein kinase [Planctomycetota bacterium]
MASDRKKGPANAMTGSEGLFGRIAVSLGFISEDQLKECLGEQSQAKHDGRDLRVGQILLKRRWLTTTQFLRIMSEQESRCGNSEGRPTMVRSEIEEASKGEGADAPEPVSQITPGKTIGRYEILRQIGRGGMGVVYEAKDTLLKRRVALKVLREDMVDPMMGRRLEKEAVTAARLKHPNIVTLFEAGIADGTRFLSMEYVEGRTLRDIMESPDVDIRRRVELVEQIARAVDYAHSRGVIHRDLKPGNVMIDAEGRPMVMDFGLARVLDDFSHASRTGALVGTPGYMAPEQIMGTSADVNARTDVYALGVMLYEMLSGRLPFDGRNPSEICNKILQQDAPPIPGVPADLEHVLRKAMHRDRNERYATAGEYADELRRFLADEPVKAAPSTVRKVVVRALRRHRTAAAVAGMALLCALAVLTVVVWSRLRRDAERRSAREEARAAEAKGDWETALRLWIRLQEMGDESAAESAKGTTRRLDEARERARAARLREDAREAEKEHARLRGALAAVEEQLRGEQAKIERHDPPEKKQNLWRLERRRDELRADLQRKEARLIGLHISAIRYDPASAAGLFEFLWGLLRQAEEDGDGARARQHEEVLRQLAEEHGLTDEKKRLEKGGTLTLVSTPPGADVDLYAFDDLPDGRLIPKLEKRGWGRTPVSGAALARGSYLLVLRRSGFRDTRFPLLLGRGQDLSLRVNLYTDEEIGAEHVYVPAGEFVSGDPLALGGGARRTRAKTGDIFIGRFEVTVLEYQEFLNDRKFHPLDECIKHAPRHANDPRHHVKVEGERIAIVKMDPSHPVSEIDWHDAAEFCAWRTARAKERGEPFAYRLPTALEWEKAARGVDGRAFVWGEKFDWTFTTGYYSEEKAPGTRRIGIIPADESVYGVRDMAGNVAEWCEDTFDPHTGRFKIVCGGAHLDTSEACFRAAYRSAVTHSVVTGRIGFRVVRERAVK